jgi:hypothetical protein
MKITNKIAVAAGVLMFVTNPLVAVHVNDGVNWAFNRIIEFSGIVSGIGLVYIIALFVIRDRQHSKLNVPVTKKAKAHTTKDGLKYELA